MELDKILQYQKVDLDLYRLEKDYSQSKEIEKLFKCKRTFEEKKEGLVQLTKELEEHISQISVLNAKMVELEGGASILSTDIVEMDEDALSAFEKELSDFEENYNGVNREVSRLVKRMNDIGFDSKRINEEMVSLNQEYRILNGALELRKKKMLQEAAPIVRSLQALLPKMDKKIMEKYKELRKAKKMPAFVAYKEGNCLACGMDISIEVSKKLINREDLAECPHCGRIVYKID